MSNIATGRFDENFIRHLSSAGQKATNTVQKSLGNIDHGLYSDVPIKCSGTDCPYYHACQLKHEMDLTTINGEPCPVEVAELIALYNGYYEEFQLDFDESLSLRGMLRELIDKEIQIRRADKFISLEPSFLEEIIARDRFNNEIVTREISKPIEYKERLMKRRGELLQLLNVTPKDKAGLKLNIIQDPSTFAARIVAEYSSKEAIIIETEELTE